MNEKSQDPEARAEARGRSQDQERSQPQDPARRSRIPTALRSRALPEAERFVRFLRT